MDWIIKFNEAINYIEEYLTDEIDLEKLGKIAGCSSFQFKRMFSYMADISLSEYIRRRKISLAAIDLLNGEKVVNVAVKYGYESPTAFNRAFQSIHGIAPSVAKAEGTNLKVYPPISFKLTIRGEAEMNYRIEKKEAFHIIGIKDCFSLTDEENLEKIPLFWQKANIEGITSKLLEYNDQKPSGVMGISIGVNHDRLEYYIAVSSNQEPPLGSVAYTVPACTWAIFQSVGPMPQAIQNLQKRVVTEWLPSSGYQYADVPDIEVYSEGDQFAPDYKCEIWLPIIKKDNLSLKRRTTCFIKNGVNER